MITAVVGRTFLKAYNQKYGKALTPKEFFDQEYFEIFFNHPKYMQWVTNSPFVQMKKGQKPHLLSTAERQEKLENLSIKINQEEADASFAIGFPASEAKSFASTSGLVSDLDIPSNEDEIYLSWIGSGLGLGVAGGYSILFDDPEITLQTFEGWKHYRKYLNEPALAKLRGNQVNSWNGQWVAYSLSADYRDDFTFGELTEEEIFKNDEKGAEVNTVAWSQLYFSLGNLNSEKPLTAYIYGHGQTNKTIGFIPFRLISGKKIREVYQKLFGEDYEIDRKDFESLFGIHIKRACELGSIGLSALRPSTLAKYMKNDKTLSFKKSQDTVTYKAYKTWLVAMLSKNKEEIIDYTQEVAKVILDYRRSGSGTGRKNHVEKELFGAFTKKKFIEALIVMIPDLEDKALATIKNLRDEVHLMTNEEFGYFATLLKFDYTFFEKQQ
ncbi:MAG: hypothetical protein WC967_06350 [Balneolaceae bacterium]